jgi:general secretion pathway protein K
MLVFALSAALVVAMKSEFNRFYERSANLLLEEQVQAYLRGAEELAIMALLRDYDEDKVEGLLRDDLQETWAMESPPYALEDVGWMRGSLEDLQGRFNLNNLESTEPRTPVPRATRKFTAAQEQFIRLLQALEEPAISESEAILITESIGDWVDSNKTPTANGAEDDYYGVQTPAYRTANRPMVSASELRAVAYVTPEIYQALLPWVTVLPATGEPTKLNIHTAPEMLLRSINTDNNQTPLSQTEAESLASEEFADLNGFLENPVFADKADKMVAIKGLLGEQSSYFLLEAEAEVAGKNMRLYSVLERRKRSVRVIARARGSL